MTRAKAIFQWFGRFLELRLRAFVYALCITVGFILGTMNTTAMAQIAIDQMGKDINALIAERHGK